MDNASRECLQKAQIYYCTRLLGRQKQYYIKNPLSNKKQLLAELVAPAFLFISCKGSREFACPQGKSYLPLVAANRHGFAQGAAMLPTRWVGPVPADRPGFGNLLQVHTRFETFRRFLELDFFYLFPFLFSFLFLFSKMFWISKKCSSNKKCFCFYQKCFGFFKKVLCFQNMFSISINCSSNSKFFIYS